MKRYVIASIFAIALLQACTKEESAPVSLNDASSPAQLQKAIQEKKAIDAPKADKSVPFESYQELKSGKQLLFAYLSVSRMPIDYEKVALDISQDYSSQIDEFKKRDILNAIKPEIDKEIQMAKGARYYYMDIGDHLEKYDFNSKSFPIPSLANSDSYRYFRDLSQYRLELTNSGMVSKLPIENEEAARTIESLRTKYNAIRLRVYFFASDTKLGEKIVRAEITKLKVMDAQGTVIAEI